MKLKDHKLGDLDIANTMKIPHLPKFDIKNVSFISKHFF